MDKLSYQELINKAYGLFQEGKLQEAYELADKYKDIEADNVSVLYDFRFSLAYALGMNDIGLKIFKEAILEKGLYYPLSYLNGDEDLKALREDPSFEELSDICSRRDQAHRYSGKPGLDIIEPKEESMINPKLLIALHGNDQSVDIVKENWNPDNYNNYIVAYPISSELSYADGHIWTDINQGVKELKMHYDKLLEKYNLNSEEITLSLLAGAGIVLDSIVNNKIDAKKLIFVGPWLPNLEDLKEKLIVLKEKNVSVFIECGDMDVPCFPGAIAFSEELERLGVNYQFKIIEGLAHDYPVNFKEVIVEIDKFLN